MTLRCIAGLEAPEKGRVELNGRVCWIPAAASVSPCAAAIGIVFQDYALFPHLTVGENIGFIFTAARRKSRGHALLTGRG